MLLKQHASNMEKQIVSMMKLKILLTLAIEKRNQ